MIFYLGNVIEDNQRFPTYLFGRESWELLHKTFFYIIYNKIALNYGIFWNDDKIYGKNLAVTINPLFTDLLSLMEQAPV